MSNKTSFKRIALAVVAALGIGLLASSPSLAAKTNETLDLSSATATAVVGDSATVVATNVWISDAAADSSVIRMSVATQPATGGLSGSTDVLIMPLTDSANVTYRTTGGATASLNTYVGTAFADPGSTVGASNRATYRIATPVFTVAGTYTFTVSSGRASAVDKVATFTVTVSNANILPATANSSVYLVGGSYLPFNANNGDSTIVVASGTTASTPTAYGWITWLQRNSESATSSGTLSAKAVGESVTAVITGAGLVSGPNNSPARSTSVTVGYNETITVWSDGRPGVASIALSTPSMTSWATKTMTFFSSTVASYTLALPTGGGVVDSLSALTGAVRVTPKDSAGNFIGSGARIYLYSSDTPTLNMPGTTACTDSGAAAKGYYECNLSGWLKSGTVNVVARDSNTVAASTVSSTAVEIKTVNRPEIVKIAFDKRSYVPGERAKIRVTVTDTNSAAIANQTIQGLFATGGITSLSTLGAVTGSISDTAVAFTATTLAANGRGIVEYVVTMPTVAGEVAIHATGGLGLNPSGRIAMSDTVTVIDPSEEAANSALDAAQEATDAAIAATDAAILAQEAADEAASAAIAAQETAQAAVDAVTALSAEVTKLVAQLATLQKLLNRVAKRVGVKL